MSKNNLSTWLVRTIVVGVLAAAMPAAAQAQTPAPSRGLWLAHSANEASFNGATGRLTMADGVLAFQSTGYEWRVPLSEIKRVDSSKNLSNALEIESASGKLFYIGILDSMMLRMSPGKAVQSIQRAVRVAPAPVQARPALAAAGGGAQ